MYVYVGQPLSFYNTEAFYHILDLFINQIVTNPLFLVGMYGKNFDLTRKKESSNKIPMRVAPMSRYTIGATFRLYLKNERKTKLRH